MKKLIGFFFLLCILGLISTSHAKLIKMENEGDSAVYDDNTKNLWVWDLSLFTNLNYFQVNTEISNMNDNKFFGLDGWHLAGYEQDVLNLFNSDYTYQEVAHLFNPSCITYQNNDQEHYFAYWAGMTGTLFNFEGFPQYAWYGVSVDSEEINENGLYNEIGQLDPLNQSYAHMGAWVMKGNFTPVPEPATILFTSIGLGGILTLRKKLKKNQ